MTHHCARLIVVAIATVSFSTPITAQQEPTSPPTVETLVETLRGNVNQNEQGEVVEVYLSRTRVTDADLAHLAGSHALQVLDLSRTRITGSGLAHLAGLTALEVLRLGNTQVTDAGLEYLAEFPALERLTLADTPITDAGLAHLTGLTALESLWLIGTQITDAGLANLTGLTALKTLYLADTQITGPGLAHLAGLPVLETLGLWNTQIADAGVAELQKALPNCGIVLQAPILDPIFIPPVPVDPLLLRHDAKGGSFYPPLSSAVSPRSDRRRSARWLG